MENAPIPRPRSKLVLFLLDLLGLVAIMVSVSLGVLIWEFSRGPISLEILKPQLEDKLTQLRDGQAVRIPVLLLEWSRDRHWIALTARNLVAMDRQGRPVIEAGHAEITFEALPFLRREIVPSDIALKDGRIRLIDPQVLAKLDTKKSPTELGWIDAAIGLTAKRLATNTLRDVNLSEFRVEFINLENEPVWSLEDISGTIHLGGQNVSMVMQTRAPTRSEQADNPLTRTPPKDNPFFTLVAKLDAHSPRFDLKIGINGNSLSGLLSPILPQAHWDYIGPFDISARIQAYPGIGVAPAIIKLNCANGYFSGPGKQVAVSDLSTTLFYDIAKKHLLVRDFALDSAAINGTFSGIIGLDPALPSDMSGPAFHVDIKAKKVRFSDPNWFAKPAIFDSMTTRGLLFLSQGLLRASDTSIGLDSFLLSGSGDFLLKFVDGRAQFGLNITAVGEGNISRDAILEHWPLPMSPEGHQWMQEQTISGQLVRMSLRVDAPLGVLDNRPLPDKALTLDFVVEDAVIRTIPELPPVAGAFGRGRLRGNSVNVDVKEARFGSWELYQGRVDIDQLYPPNKDGRVRVRGRGAISDLMLILDEAGLNSSSEHGLDVARMEGTGDLGLELFFPLEELSEEELETLIVPYTVTGTFENAGVPDLLGEFGLKNAGFELEGTEKGYTLNGKGLFAEMPIDFTWSETIIKYPDVTKSHLSATGTGDENTLNTLGFAVYNVLKGPVQLAIKVDGDGPVLHTIAIEYDFTDAALNLPVLSWEKPPKMKAHAKSYYGLDKDSGEGSLLLDFEAQGLDVAIEAVYDEAGDLLRANIGNIRASNRFEGRANITHTKEDGYVVGYLGKRFDLSPLLEGFEFENLRGEIEFPPIKLNLDTEELGLLDGKILKNTNVEFNFSGTEVRSAHVSGATEDGKRFTLALSSDSETRSTMLINTDDAGFMLHGLTGSPFMEGGEMATSVTFDPEGISARIDIRDAHLKNAPVLVQILSLASVRSLIDVLSNKGLFFSEISLPLEIRNQQISTPGARASGPGLGVTTRGWMLPNSGELAFDGVIVPSFGINSMLGGLPLIGDLFVSREGEGVFAVVYSVRGDVDNVDVRVNPFSAIAPGILRRVFENPIEPLPDHVLERQKSLEEETEASEDTEPLPSQTPLLPPTPSLRDRESELLAPQ